MLTGIWLIVLSLILLGFFIYWGVTYTKKNIHEHWKKKYKVAIILFSIGAVSAASYMMLAKKFMHNIDLVISWFFLSTGLLFSASLSFFIGYYSDQNKKTGSMNNK